MSNDKKTREYVYKCRLCNELKAGAIGCFSLMEAQAVLFELEDKSLTYRLGAMIGRVQYHLCSDGSLGIADLIGVRDQIL